MVQRSAVPSAALGAMPPCGCLAAPWRSPDVLLAPSTSPPMDHRNRFLHFLDRYAAKDVTALLSTLAPDVTLRDWHLAVRGRDRVEAFLRQNFADADTLSIEVLALHESAHSVAGELRILVDGCFELFAVDVIEFDADGMIRAIRSYKGRGDKAKSGNAACRTPCSGGIRGCRVSLKRCWACALS